MNGDSASENRDSQITTRVSMKEYFYGVMKSLTRRPLNSFTQIERQRGNPNLTILIFCEWANSDLLPSSSLEPHYPRKVGVETCRRWMHELGFEIVDGRKGIYIDGHERKDVVESRQTFYIR